MNRLVKWIKSFPIALKESTLLRAVIAVGVAINLGALFYQNTSSLDQNRLFDLKLAITLILVEVPLFMFSPLLYGAILNESRKHAKEIGEEVGKQLVKVPLDVNLHLQNLNTVYRKLFHLRLWETNQNVWVMQALVELDGDQLMYALNIPDLNRALVHLKQNDRYKILANLWENLGSCVRNYNENIPSFVEFLENHIRKVMSQKTKYVEQKNDEEGYSVNPIRQSLMYLLSLQSEGIPIQNSFHIRISKIYNTVIWFETHALFIDNGLFLIVNGDPEKIKDEVVKLLIEIATDSTVLSKYKSYYGLLQKMKNANQQFKDNLAPLIHDIEKNGFTVKGECDLGY